MGPSAGSPSSGRPLPDVLAENIRRARKKKRMSVPALAQSTGQTLEFIEDLERGRIPELRLGVLESFAAALDVETAALVSRQPRLRPRRKA
jgi:transcriptional regulator with XRE-family HTH domain